MPVRAQLLLAAGLIAVAACKSSVESPPPPDPSKAVALEMTMSSAPVFLDTYRRLSIRARNAYRDPVSTKGAVVTVSNSQIAVVEAVYTVDVSDDSSRPVEALDALVHFLAPGSVTLHVTLGELFRNVDVAVYGLPDYTDVMAVDSFTVLEVPSCASGCPLLYAPILRLRAASSSGPVEVTGVEIKLPSLTSGFCDGSMTYQAGQSADLIYYEDGSSLAWSSALLLASPGAAPVPDGPVTARVIVRDSYGDLGLVEASGSIQRMVESPVVPRTSDADLLNWSCPDVQAPS